MLLSGRVLFSNVEALGSIPSTKINKVMYEKLNNCYFAAVELTKLKDPMGRAL